MFGNGRGEKILGLATPQPLKHKDMLTRKPLSFAERMRNTQNFLDDIRNDGSGETIEVNKSSSVSANADRVVFGSFGFMTLNHNGEQGQTGEVEDEATHQEGDNDDRQADDNDRTGRGEEKKRLLKRRCQE